MICSAQSGFVEASSCSFQYLCFGFFPCLPDGASLISLSPTGQRALKPEVQRSLGAMGWWQAEFSLNMGIYPAIHRLLRGKCVSCVYIYIRLLYIGVCKPKRLCQQWGFETHNHLGFAYESNIYIYIYTYVHMYSTPQVRKSIQKYW